MQKISKKELLPFLKPYLPENPVIVEAGSFNGKDTVILSNFWPQGTIHAFEPVPEIFSLLSANTDHCSNVHRYRYALGARTEAATLYLSADPEKPDKPYPAASLLPPKERLTWSKAIYPKSITSETITLDHWGKQNCIDHIDFLWLDVQGYALPILQASEHMLATIKVVHVEVEFVEAYENQKQYPEVKKWLEQQGFSMIARDFDDQPSWFFGNALFIRL